MADLYIITGTTTNGNGTEEIVLARDEETGEVSKYISTTHAEDLSKAEKATVEECGCIVGKVSTEDAEELQQQQLASVGGDTAGGAPVLGSGSVAKDSSPKQHSDKADPKGDK